MYCTNCGKEIADQSEFCEHCGAKLSEKEENEAQQPAPKASGKKKIAVAAAIACVAVIAVIGIAVSVFLQNPKQKILRGAAKTFQAAVKGDTTLNGILGLDEMVKEISGKSVTQTLEIIIPEGDAGIKAQISSDKKSSLMEIYPTWNNMELGEVIFYKEQGRLYFGLPDVLDDMFYVDLTGIKDEYSGSSLDRFVREQTGMDVADFLPEDEDSKESKSYWNYCKEELGNLYQDIEVEKDGKETIRINGKSRKCDKYRVTIPGSSMKDIVSASVDYIFEEYPLPVVCMVGPMAFSSGMPLRSIKQNVSQVLSRLKIRDMEMTVCLDKKGRLVSCEGDWTLGYDGNSATLEYNGKFTGGASPMDEVEASLLISADGEELEIGLDRKKNFQKKSALKDQAELTVTDSWAHGSYTDTYTYEFSYNLQNGKWDMTLAEEDYNYSYGLQAEGQISNVKKGKELSFRLDELTDLSGGYSYAEGKYELAGLGKDGVKPLRGIEKGINLFDMSKAEILGVGKDLAENWLMNEITGGFYGFGSSSGGTYETTAAPTTAAAGSN